MVAQQETAQLPISALSGEELVKRVDDYFQDAVTARRDAEIRWLQTMAMLEGYHYLKVDYTSRKILIERTVPPGEVRAKIDDMVMRYEEAMGRFATAPILPTCLPKGTSSVVWLKIRGSQSLLDHFRQDEQYGFESSYLNLIQYILTGGTSAWYVGWNNEKEMPTIEAVPPWELYPFPATAKNDEQLSGVIRATIVDREWVQTYYPDFVNVAPARTFHDSSNGYGAYGGRGLQTQGYLVKFVFFKPTAAWPKGRALVLIEDKLAYDTGEAGLPSGLFPFAFVRYTGLANYWWGLPLLHRVANMNKELNRLFSNMISSAELIANGGYLFIPQGYVDMAQLHKQKGGIIPYSQTPFTPDEKPHAIQPPRAGSELQMMFNTAKQQIDDMTSQHDISRGQAQGRVDSAQGLGFLRDEDMTPLSMVSMDLQKAAQHVFRCVLQFCHDYWTSPKRISIIGKDELPLEMLLGNDAIATADEVMIEVSPVIPQSKQFLMQQLDKLLQMQQITPHQYKKGMMALGVKIPGMDDLQSVDERKASIENRVLFNDGQQPGQLPAILEFEDHPVHLDTHRKYVSSFEFALTANPEIQNAFRQHMNTHQGFMSGQTQVGNPQDFDSGMAQFDQQQGDLRLAMMENRLLIDDMDSIPPLQPPPEIPPVQLDNA